MKKQKKEMRRHEEILQLIRDNFATIKSYKGVTGTGVGLKSINGKFTDELCIYIEVKKKMPLSKLSTKDIIPAYLEGVKTDVVEKTRFKLQDLLVKKSEAEFAERVRPLEGGTQVTNGIVRNGTISVGTLGALVFVPVKKNAFVGIMSNHHVLYARDAGDGQPIGQPTGNETVGFNVRGVKLSGEVDFGLARMADSVKGSNRVKTLGNLTGFANAITGEEVRKYGITTGITRGKVTTWVFGATNRCVFSPVLKFNTVIPLPTPIRNFQTTEIPDR